jgi:hypothetical protein
MNSENTFLKNILESKFIKKPNKSTLQSVNEIETKIFKILTGKKFRISKLPQEFIENLQEKIRTSIKNNAPITLIIADGGFKNYKFKNAPHIDWSEIFHIYWVISNLFKITSIYKPGVIVEFTHDAEACVIVNNYKDKWIKTYCKEFDQVLSYFTNFLPDNFILKSRNFTNFYSITDIENEINKRIAQGNTKDFPNHSINSALNNYCFSGNKNQTKLSNSSKEEILKTSYQKCTLWLNIDYERRRDYLEGGINIPVIHKKGIPNTLPIYSVHGCIIQYWIGIGVLMKTSSKLMPWILSYNQFSHTKLEYRKVTFKNDLLTQLPFLRTIPVLMSNDKGQMSSKY